MWSENKIGTQIWEAQPGDTLERAKAAAVQHKLSFVRHAGILYELRQQVVATALGRLDVIPPEQSEFAVGDIVQRTDCPSKRQRVVDTIGDVVKLEDGAWCSAQLLTLVLDDRSSNGQGARP